MSNQEIISHRRICDEVCDNRWMVEWKVIVVGFLVLFDIVLNLVQLMGS